MWITAKSQLVRAKVDFDSINQLPTWVCLQLPFRPSVLPSFCPSAILSFCPSVLLSFCPSVILSFCPSVLPPFCPSALLYFGPYLLPPLPSRRPYAYLSACPSARSPACPHTPPIRSPPLARTPVYPPASPPNSLSSWGKSTLCGIAFCPVEPCRAVRQCGCTDVRWSRNVPRTSGWTNKRWFWHTYACWQTKLVTAKFSFKSSTFLTFVLEVKDYDRLNWKDCTGLSRKRWQIGQTLLLPNTGSHTWSFDGHIYIWPWPILKVNNKAMHLSNENISQTVKDRISITITITMKYEVAYAFSMSYLDLT